MSNPRYETRHGLEYHRGGGGRRLQRHKRKQSTPTVLEPLDRHYKHRTRHRNQSSREEEDEADQVAHGRHVSIASSHYAYPPITMVCLSPTGYFHGNREEDESDPHDRYMYRLPGHQGHQPHRTRKRNTKLKSRRRSTPSSSSSHDEGDSKISDHGIRSQRVRSLQAMARVQRNAARVIQQEFRFYRNRTRNRTRQLACLHAQTKALFDSLLYADIIPTLISDALLSVLREDAAQRAMKHLTGEHALVTYSEDIYHNLLGSLVHDVFQAVVDSMVREYLVSRVDLSRLSQPSSHIVADDVLHEWLVELVAEVMPEALSEVVASYMDARRQDECFCSLVEDELRNVAVETAIEMTLAGMVDSLTLAR